ncbi:MAG TPA: 3-hydroxyacyl-CoA dehydrogenase NAD-binding domain-containing protein [Pirellulaceae bacterium]|jgi:3-hydroxybutyryl-CoA dehydrogenase|nr:3-hydroxyacyl-CoA dehydrogenase NAD-binding domain-containing protein [Pirellulaceae bacterium]
MSNPPIKNVCVVGSGFMGSQIALQCAVYGYHVSMHDVSQTSLRRCAAEQASMLDEQIEAGVVSADRRQTIQDRIQFTGSLSEAAIAADLVIEAAREDLDVKREVFQALDGICAPHAILVTNSSSLRVSRIESATNRPDKVLNTHFCQAVWKHPFVELMRGTTTSEETLQAVREFAGSIGLVPILVRRQVTGCILARIWRAVKKEALHLVDSGVATPEDVDRTWMIAMEAPLGPFILMDRIGLDVIRDIEMVYHEESGDESDAPPKVLLEKIEKGELGVKTGKGFYTYPNPAYESPEFLREASP